MGVDMGMDMNMNIDGATLNIDIQDFKEIRVGF